MTKIDYFHILLGMASGWLVFSSLGRNTINALFNAVLTIIIAPFVLILACIYSIRGKSPLSGALLLKQVSEFNNVVKMPRKPKGGPLDAG